MTKEHDRTTTAAISRRNLLAALPLSGAAFALPTSTRASSDKAILAVIKELETVQGWEASNVVAARVYAAYIIREALGLNISAECAEYANLHLSCQKTNYEWYQQSVWFQRDQADGKFMPAPRSKL